MVSQASSSASAATSRDSGSGTLGQPLYDAITAHINSPTLNHSLQRTFGPAIAAFLGEKIRSAWSRWWWWWFVVVVLLGPICPTGQRGGCSVGEKCWEITLNQLQFKKKKKKDLLNDIPVDLPVLPSWTSTGLLGVCVCVCIYIYICVCMCPSLYIYMCMCVCGSLSLSLSLSLSIYIYIYIYVCRCPSPPRKRQRVEQKTAEQEEGLPKVLQREIANLGVRFHVSLDPLHHNANKTIHLVCKLGERSCRDLLVFWLACLAAWLLGLWWSLCTLCFLKCQARGTVGDSGLCCCVRMTSFES